MAENGDDIVARLERIATKMFQSGNWGSDLETVKDAMSTIVDLRVDLEVARGDAKEAEAFAEELLDKEAQGPRNGELRVVNYVQGFGRSLRKTASGETLGPLFNHRLEQYFDGAWRGIRVFQETGSGNMMEIKQ